MIKVTETITGNGPQVIVKCDTIEEYSDYLSLMDSREVKVESINGSAFDEGINFNNAANEYAARYLKSK